MNVNDIAVFLVTVLVCSTVAASAGPGTATTTETVEPTTNTAFGGKMAVFVQHRAAATNGSVDSGMWLAAFDHAENQSRKRALVEHRTGTLGARLDRIEERVRGFTPTRGNRSVRHRAQWARLAADVEALRTSINDAKTEAASEGVNTTGLDRLTNRATSLSVPNAGSTQQSRNGDRPYGANEHSDARSHRRSPPRHDTA